MRKKEKRYKREFVRGKREERNGVRRKREKRSAGGER